MDNLKELKIKHKNLLGTYENSEYKKYIEHYINNLLNIFFIKIEKNNFLKKVNKKTQLSDGEIVDIKKSIINCIKDVNNILKNEENLKYLKDNYENKNYNTKDVLGKIRQLSKYIKNK